MISLRGGVPVLMYHALSPACTSGFCRWTLSPDRFESHLGYLRQEGYRAITVAELAERRRHGALDPSARLIVLTFDDAYADFLDVAMPAPAAVRDDGDAVRAHRICRRPQRVDARGG